MANGQLTYICPECRGIVQPGAAYCMQCGASLQPAGVFPGSGRLTVTRGNLAQPEYVLTGQRMTLGRAWESSLLLPEDDLTTSRRHAEIYFEGGQFIINDLGSMNGTFVNGRRIQSEVLRPGDEIRLGNTLFRFEGGAEPAAARPMAQALGSYELVNTIGTGGMATVYLGRAPNGALVALKVPLPQFANDSEFAARFQREIEIGQQLDHPNIVKVYGVIWDNAVPVMVMEYADGGSLRSWIQPDSNLPYGHLCGVIGQCCNALSAAHNKGVVHRDVKPENILFNSAGLVKITDFGIARLVARKTITAGRILGSPFYMSPEQAQGSPNLDARSDIYSLCVVAYELATGQPPFLGSNFVEVLNKHIREPPVSPAQIRRDMPPGIEQAIMRGLQKDPVQRFASAPELAQCFTYY